MKLKLNILSFLIALYVHQISSDSIRDEQREETELMDHFVRLFSDIKGIKDRSPSENEGICRAFEQMCKDKTVQFKGNSKPFGGVLVKSFKCHGYFVRCLQLAKLVQSNKMILLPTVVDWQN